MNFIASLYFLNIASRTFNIAHATHVESLHYILCGLHEEDSRGMINVT